MTHDNTNMQPRALYILQINLRHSRAASLLLAKTVEDYKVDVIMAQEPYATGEKAIEPMNIPSGFVAHHQLSEDHRYGTVILVRETIPSILITTSSRNELTCVRLYSGQSSLLLISAYCRPSVSSLSSILLPALEKERRSLSNSIVCIDSNAKSKMWNSLRTDDRGEELEDLALHFALHVANVNKSELPFVPGGTAFVDVTLRGERTVLRDWRYLEDPSLSDHPYILMGVSLPSTQEAPRREATAPAVGNIDKEVFRRRTMSGLDRFTATVVLRTSTMDSINKQAEGLMDVVVSAARASRVRKRATRKSLAPWWSDKLEQLRSETRGAYRQWNRVRTQATKAELAKKRRHYQREIRRGKSQFIRDFCTTAMNKDAQTALKQLKGDAAQKTAPGELLVNGEIESDATTIMRTFADQFFHQEPPSTNLHTNTEEAAMRFADVTEPEEHPPITVNEMDQALKGLRKSAAPGINGVTVLLLSLVFSIIKLPLMNLFNLCLKKGIFPWAWKKAKVSVIRKPGKSNYMDPGSFRPISVLDSMGKLFEKVILRRLTWLCESGRWLSENQHGFRAGKSTETALHALVAGIEQSFAAKSVTACLFLDIKSAFDAAWPPGIIAALGTKGCPGYLIRIIRDFLSGRRAVLKNQDKELLVDVSVGCPQGSLLSPILWNILIDEMLRIKLPGNTRILAYADDITLSSTHKDPAMAVANLNKALEIIRAHLSSIKLSLNASKTVMMVFSKRAIPLSDLSVEIEGHRILPSRTTKLLGVILDQHLKWKDHIDEREQKFKRVIHTVRRFLGRNWGLSRHRLRTIYTAVAEPTLLYACSIWASVVQTKRGTKRLRSIERVYNKMTMRTFRTVDTGALSILTGSLPIDYRIRETILRRLHISNFKTVSPSAARSVAELKMDIQFSTTVAPETVSHPPPWTQEVDCVDEEVAGGASLPSAAPFSCSSLTQSTVSKKEAARIIRDTMMKSWADEWRSSSKGNTTRAFFPNPDCISSIKPIHLAYQVIQVLSLCMYERDRCMAPTQGVPS